MNGRNQSLYRALERWCSTSVMMAIVSCVIVSTFVAPFQSIAFAATGAPRILNNQGRLMDGSGNLLGGSGTDYCFRFSFYDSSTVGSGSKLWPSGSPSTMTVPVKNGVYNVGIGDTNAGGDVLDFNFEDTDAVYLNVEVASKVGATCAAGDGAESFENLAPRQRIYSAGYAINASTLRGYMPYQSASSTQIPVLSDGNLYLGGVNPYINATSSFTLTFQGGGQSGDIQFFNASNKITASGNATFAGHLSSQTATFTAATSSSFAITGTASTSDLVVSNSFRFGTSSGILKAVAGVVSQALVNLATDITGVLGIGNGGTGTSTAPTYGQVLLGNASGGYDLVSTTSLGISQDLSGYLSRADWYATTTDGLDEGLSNRYYQDSRVQTYLDTMAKTFFFATSSADYWKTQNNFFSTSSADYYRLANNFFATSSADYWKSQNNFYSTTSADYWKTQNNFFATTSADYWETQQTARTADDISDDSIETLSDVAAMTKNYGDLLFWNGTAWQDIATSSLALNFTDIAGVATNAQVADDLTIDGGNINNTPIGASAPSTAQFTNATTTNFFTQYFSTSNGTFGVVAATSSATLASTTVYGRLITGSLVATSTATSTMAGPLSIGAQNGSYKVSILGSTTGPSSATGTAILAVSNDNATLSSGTNVLRLNLRTPYGTSCTSASTCPRFIEYFTGVGSGADTGGRGVGSLRLSTAGTGITQTSGSADFAEFMQLNGPADFGDIVSLNASGEYQKAVAGQSIVGVISENPAFVGNANIEGEPNAYIVGFAGVVPTTVSTANGAINAGDLITASTTAGVGVKLTQSGYAVGQALESYSGVGNGTIDVLVMPKYVDAAVALESYGGGGGGISGYLNLATSTGEVMLASTTYSLVLTNKLTVENASTTRISAAYASSTQAFFGALSVGSLTGVLRASAGAVSTGLVDLATEITGILAVENGGTGISDAPTYGQVLLGNASGGYDLVSTTSLGISQDLSGYLSRADWYATTTDGLDEGLSNFYYQDSRVQTYLDTMAKTFFFATSSADYWKTQNNFFSTSSADYYRLANNFFATSSADYWKSQNNFYSTTSADYWKTQNNFFATTSVDYWETQQTARTADDISDDSIETLSDVAAMTEVYGDVFVWNGSAWTNVATSSLGLPTTETLANYLTLTDWYATTTDGLDEGLNNLYFTNGRVQTYLATVDKGFFFSTTSADAWKGNRDFFSTTSSEYWKSVSNFFSTTSADYYSASNNFFSTSSAQYFVDASTTIAKTYASNVFIAPQTFNGGLTISVLDGPLQANNGVVSATTSIGVNYGGTGRTDAPSYGQVLVGNASGGYDLLATTSLGINSGVWGAITGNIADQSDLQTALNQRLALVDFYATTTQDIAEGGSNLYYQDSRVQTYLDTMAKTFFFATSSADYWKTQNNFFSTTSADYYRLANNFFATSSADYWKSQNNFYSTTSADYWKSVSNFFSTTSTQYFADRGLAFSTSSALNFAAAGLAFSTTSSDYWQNQRNFFSTSSADYYRTSNNFFSTTSADYWETQQAARTADDLSNNSIEDLNDVAAITENYGDLLVWNGSSWADIATSALAVSSTDVVEGSQLFYQDSRVQTYLDTMAKTFFFATSSADYWKTQNNFFSTSSADFYRLANNFYSTTSADYWKSVNNFYSTTSADYYTHSSSTIPKTYTGNTFTGTNVFSGDTTLTHATATSFFATVASSSRLYGAGLVDCTGGNKLTWSGGSFTCATDLTGSGAAFAFTPGTFGATLVNATGTALQLQGGLFASSSVQFGNAGISQFQFSGSNGRLGLGSTTPYAKLSVHALSSEAPGTLFAISSSSPSGDRSLFAVDSAGLATFGDAAGTGDATFQFASDANAWVMGYNTSDKSFRIASSTNLATNVALEIDKGGTTILQELQLPAIANCTQALETDSQGNIVCGTDVQGGGAGGSGVWATTTNDLAQYPTDPSRVVIIGASATSSNGNILEVSGNARVSGTATTTNLVVSSGFTFGSVTGVLKAAAGAVSAGLVDLATEITGILAVENGGTGISDAPAYGEVLVGNASGGYDLVSTSSLGITQDLSNYLSLAAWYATTTQDIAEGGTNLYYQDARVQTYLNTMAKTFFFATSSADYWKTQNNFFSTTSADYYRLANNFFATSSADYWKSQNNFFSTTSSLYFASAGLAWATSSADYWETQQGSRSADDLSDNSIEDLNDVAAITEDYGDLLYWDGSSWVDVATSSLALNIADTIGTLDYSRGGTGQTAWNKGDILYASDDNVLQRLAVGSPGTVLKVSGAGVPQWGTDLTVGGGGGGGGIWATTSTALAIYPVDTTDIVLVGTNATSTSDSIFEVVGKSTLTGNVDIVGTASTSDLIVSGSVTFDTLTGVLKATAGVVSAALLDLATDVTGILGISNGGTGTSTAPSYGQVLVGNAVGGYDLVSTSSLGISGGDLSGYFTLADWYATTTQDIAEGGSNLYYQDARVQTYLDTIGKGYYFSTTSAQQFAAVGLAFSTTSSDFWRTARNFFSSTSAEYFVHSSSTIPKTYTNNTYTGNNTFGGTTQVNNFVATAIGASTLSIGTVSTSTIQGGAVGTSTLQGFLNVTGTNSTSTFSAAIAATRLNLTSSNSTSTAANGFNISDGCYAIDGICIGAGGGVSTVSNNDSTLTVSPNSGAVVVSLNLSNANIWTGLQRFGSASSTAFSALDYMSVGRTATSSIQGSTTGTSTLQGFLNVLGVNSTSTFSGGLAASRLNVTGGTSTFANGINLTGGCFAVNGNCIGNDVDSVTVSSFTGDGTWTKSNYPGITFTHVITTGGGGGGGGADGTDTTNETIGGGGGAGGTAIEMIPASALGTTETVTVGTGGTAGVNTGGNGGTGNLSSFGSHNSANGGGGGVGSAANATGCAANDGAGEGGAGGTASGGDINITGGAGHTGICLAELTNGGTGGASYWGGGGRGAVDGTGAVAGSAGAAYGSGGGGAADEDNTTGAVGGTGANGIVVTMNYTSSSGDLAEWYETEDGVEAGDVVALGSDTYEYDSRLGLQKSAVLVKATSGTAVVGVIASAPYETMGADILGKAQHPRAVALAGRVPVKVTRENGDVKAGDLLTVSSEPGYAMRALKAGLTLGRALEDAVCSQDTATSTESVIDAECTVLVMVNTSYSTGALLKVALRDSGVFLDEIPGDFDMGRLLLAEMLQKKQNITASTTLSEMYTDRIAAGIEIITPRLIAQTVVTNVIEPVDKDVRIRLAEGAFVIEGVQQSDMSVTFENASSSHATSSTAVSIDALGNALFAGTLKAANFEIGSKDAPGGLTMYDTATGQPYCTRITKGTLKTVPGRCDEGVNLDIASLEGAAEEDNSDVPATGSTELGMSGSPVITLNGNNPAHIEKGSSYVDLGATVRDDKDENLAMKTFIDGEEVIEVTLDTSEAKEYVITYQVTDNDSNVVQKERRVVVTEPAAVIDTVEEETPVSAAEESDTPVEDTAEDTTAVPHVQDEIPSTEEVPAPAGEEIDESSGTPEPLVTEPISTTPTTDV